MLDEVSRDFTAEPTTPGAVRRFLRDTLHTWALDGFGEVTELLASELAANVVRHVGTSMTVRAILETPNLFRIEVDDRSHELPDLRPANQFAEAWRGLRIVDSLADDWGTRITEGGKTVWFTIDATTAEHEVHDGEPII